MANDKIAAVATPIPEHEDLDSAAELLASGKTLQKAGTPFVTAISVQKPRNLDKIVAAMDREAEYAGKTFWYSWRDKKGNLIEGPSIGLANSLAREWTNCGVTVDFQETAETFILTPRFIDIEKGYQCERVFRQHKGVVQGNFDPERKLDMALQIGQSKAIRNVVCNAVPKWLVQRAIQKAKDAVVKGIDPAKLGELKKEVAAFFHDHGVTLEQLVAKAKRPMAEWTTLTIATFQADMHAVESGEVAVEEIFRAAEPKKEVDGPLTGKTIGDAIIKDPTGEDPIVAKQRELDKAKASQQGGPSAEEQDRIKKREEFESYALQCTKCPPLTFGTNDAEEFKKHQADKHPNGNKPTQDKKSGDMFGPKK